MSWKGMSDSRAEPTRPKPGGLDMSKKAKSGGDWKGITETFADRRDAGSGGWKGEPDSRPTAAGK